MKQMIVGAASAVLLLANTATAQANSAQTNSSSAQTSSAKRLSLSNNPVRASTAAGDSNELRGGFIIPLIAVVAIILGILAATSGSDRPASP